MNLAERAEHLGKKIQINVNPTKVHNQMNHPVELEVHNHESLNMHFRS